jgi:5-aminolevulinate synthase
MRRPKPSVDGRRRHAGKSLGVVGGYIASSRVLCDFIRSFASGFIFTTALPPSNAAGALASVRYLKASDVERVQLQRRVARLRQRLDDARIPHLRNDSHIVPVMVRDPVLCKQISDRMLSEYGIYIQPINYPTVARGAERLRITPSPLHGDADADRLAACLATIWKSECSLCHAGCVHRFEYSDRELVLADPSRS